MNAHAQRIRDVGLSHPIVLIDTDYHTTVSYGYFRYDIIIRPSPDIIEDSESDLHIYLSADVPFIQDGTRFDEEERNVLDKSHRFILNENKTKYVDIRTNDYEYQYIKTKSEILDLISFRQTL